MQHVETVETVLNRVELFSNLTGFVENRCTVFAGQSTLPNDNHRLLRVAKRISRSGAAIEDVRQRLRPCADPGRLVRQVMRRTNAEDL